MSNLDKLITRAAGRISETVWAAVFILLMCSGVGSVMWWLLTL